MDEINFEFNIPFYIFESIVDYVELTAKDKSDILKLDNLKSLMRLAVMSKKLSQEQADFLLEKYCHEKKTE